MPELGHVVFYVSDLQRSIEFYRDFVGLSLEGLIFNDRAAVFTGGRAHHELLLIEVKNVPGPRRGPRIGLYHVGWKIGESLDVLREKYARALESGYEVEGLSDHTVSQSLYLNDPDGNEVELFVDDPHFDWRNDKSWMEAPVRPLRL